MLNDCGWRIGCLGIFLFLLGCYQQKIYDGDKSGDGGCGERDRMAVLDPKNSTIVVKYENGQEAVEASGQIAISVDDCSGSSCRLEVELMEVTLPTVTWENYTFSNAVLTLDDTALGTVDEQQNISITNTSFYVNFSATVGGIPISSGLATPVNVGGGYDAETGELILTGTLIQDDDSAVPVELPWVEIPFLFTAYQNCAN